MEQEQLLQNYVADTHLEDGEHLRIVEGKAWQSVDRNLWAIRENEKQLRFNARPVKEHVKLTSELRINSRGDEVTEYVTCQILFNQVVAYGFTRSNCDVLAGMQIAKEAIEALRRISFLTQWTRAEIACKLIGRPVYWREQAGFVADYITDSGVVILRPENGTFSPRPWEPLLCGMTSVDVDLLDEDIHWHREV